MLLCLVAGTVSHDKTKAGNIQVVWLDNKVVLLSHRYCLEREDPSSYVLCDTIGRTGSDNEWKTECFRIVGDHEKPLMLQSLWKPKEGFSRRFEIQKRESVEAQSAKDTDTITAGIC